MAEAKKADMYVWEGMDKSGKRVKGESSGQSNCRPQSLADGWL